MKLEKTSLLNWLLAFSLAFGIVACSGTQKKSATPIIQYDIAPEAKVISFEYYLKNWQKKDTLHYKIRVKNVADKVHRYRVIISIPGADSVGGLIPRKPKKKFEPGIEKSFVYPVLNYTEIPKKIEVTVMVID